MDLPEDRSPAASPVDEPTTPPANTPADSSANVPGDTLADEPGYEPADADLPTGYVDFVTEAPIGGELPARWIHGSPSARRNTDPAIQVHRYDPHTVVLRQNKAVHYEAPFIYLLFGNERALLLDTGATAEPTRFPLRETVDGLISEWLADHPRPTYPLVVAHTHGHSDHVGADAQFADRPDTTVVAADAEAVRAFFGLPGYTWFDLGGRLLEVTPIPGHHAASIAIFDPWTGFLLTGDTVYRGRLYVDDIAAFTDSLDTLVAIAANRPVSHVMGCHIEMRQKPRRDYPIGARYQPDEPVVQMTPAHLTTVRNAAVAVADRPGVHVFDDFEIFNGPCRRAVAIHRLRALWSTFRDWLISLFR
jgi:glyoxylase-like metal-dependent hydrolase (beta-lactamase superfamily II)